MIYDLLELTQPVEWGRWTTTTGRSHCTNDVSHLETLREWVSEQFLKAHQRSIG